MHEQSKRKAPFQVGEVFTKEIDLGHKSIRKFAEFVGDPNPLHHDSALAQASRFGGLIKARCLNPLRYFLRSWLALCRHALKALVWTFTIALYERLGRADP